MEEELPKWDEMLIQAEPNRPSPTKEFIGKKEKTKMEVQIEDPLKLDKDGFPMYTVRNWKQEGKEKKKPRRYG
jgi:hypothetical protein